MKGLRSSEHQVLEAFLKSTQYLVRLQSQQDIWEHVGRFVLTHFPADWLAFVELDSGNNVSLGYCTLPAGTQYITANEVRTLVADVLESGFLASRVLLTPAPSMTAFLPIVENCQTKRVMLIGHADDQPLSKELLGIYLALAGLAGTASERKRAEEEILRLNAQLEQRVAKRTAQLQTANDELRREIAERKRVEEALRESREWLRVTLTSIGDAVMTSDSQGRITFLNPVAESLTGWKAKEVLSQQIQSVFQIINDQTGVPAEDIISRVLKEQRVFELANHTALITKDGRKVPVEDSAAPITDVNGKVVGAVLVFHDVTEKRRREEQLRRLNRTLKALNSSNQAMLHSTDEAVLLEQICRIITEDCGHAMVWIGFAEDDEHRTIRPVAHAGFEEGYLETLRLSWADTERGRGPTGMAIRTCQPCVCRDMLTDPRFEPWRAEALKRGYASSLVLPLKEDGKAFGAITIYSREPDAFLDDEVKLLEELTADLAYGISTLRVRAAREQAEKALRQHREWLRVTLTSIGDAVMTADTNGRVTFLNPVAAALTGWRPEEAQGQPIQNVFQIINEQTRVPAEDIVARVLKEGHVIELANHTALLAKDGREIPVEDSVAPILDGDSKVIGVVVVFHDVTEKRRAQERITHLASFPERNPDFIFETDLEGRIMYLNPAARRQFPTLEETGARHPLLMEWPMVLASLRAGVGPLIVREAEVDGFVLLQRVSYLPQLGVVRAYCVDITERKRAEDALLRSEKLASVGRMAASIAHEINNPLAAVMNALYLASSNLDEREVARQFLDTADDELKRIAHITRQTLGFYRESSAPTTVSVNSILDSAVDLLRGKIKVKRASIEKQYDGNLQVAAVSGELRQVFSNLLANSLDAIHEDGTIKLRVSRSTCVNSGQPRIRVTVADGGQGIDPATLPRIFEPLFTTKEATGSGLGLWVSMQLIGKHQGSIRVRSSTNPPRRGTVFSILLPVETAPLAESAASGSS